MNLSKCAAFYVLKRFPIGNISSHNPNLNFSKRYFKRFLYVRRFSTLNETGKEGAAIVQTDSCDQDVFTQLESIQKNCKNRAETLKEIWKKNSDLSLTFMKAYLQTCVDNAHIDFNLDTKVFFEKANGDAELLSLLLKYSCYKGNVGDIVKVLSAMKDAEIPADESVFNMIVLGHVVNDGINGGESALKTLKAAKIPVTEDTHWSTIKGLSRRKDKKEFTTTLKGISSLTFNEEDFFEVLYVLSVYDNHLWIENFLNFIDKDRIPRTSLKNLQNICFCLVREEKPEAAYLLYKHLEEDRSDFRFGVDLLEEMVTCQTPTEKMLTITSDLITTERNPLALLDLTELVLRSDDKSNIWQVFSELDTLKPHYFWPMFLKKGKEAGEKGVFEVLSKMYELKTKPDYDTLSYYLLDFCDFRNIDDLIRRLDVFKELTMRELFNPVLYQLLNKERIVDAKIFCEKYNFPIFGDRLIKQLCVLWGSTKKSNEIVYILQRICETNPQSNDWTGKFLVKCMKLCTSNENDHKAMLELIDVLRKSGLKISSLLADYAYATLNVKFKGSKWLGEIEAGLDKLLDVTKPDSLNIIQHPKDMNLEELESHYIELSNKQMETRGVLQRLINGYSRVNNFARVQELREVFEQNGYKEAAGMKSQLLNTYIELGNLTEARKFYEDIKSSFPEFTIDSYKIINFAKLMIEMGELVEAMSLLRTEKTDIKNMSSIERNCWRLLNSAKNPSDANKCLDVLIEEKYCTPTNIILGPIIRSHLKNNDLSGAVEAYINYTTKYRRTPLQLELIDAILKTKDDQLLGRVINATAEVHGIDSARLTLISALAQNGMVKPLHKILTEIPKINTSELRRRCDRWVTEKKLVPLLTLYESAKRLTGNLIDVEYVRLCIIRAYGAQNDHESALGFWKQLETENLEDITPLLRKELNNLLRRCKVQNKLLN